MSIRLGRVGFLTCMATSLLVACPGGARGADDPLLGTFSTAEGAKSPLKFVVKAGETAGAYSGSIEKDGKSYPFNARRDASEAGRLSGTFASGDRQFPLEAVLANGHLTVTTGKSAFVLLPEGNPLDVPAANPLDTSAAVPATPSGAAMQKPAEGAAAARTAQIVNFVPRKITDDGLGMDAVSLLVPDGWKLDGKVLWVSGGSGLALQDISVTDPDVPATARFYPQFNYADGEREAIMRGDAANGGGLRNFNERRFAEGNLDSMGREIRHMPPTPIDFVKSFLVPRYRPDMNEAKNITIIEDKDMPDYAAKIAALRLNARATSSRIRITYSLGDQTVEELFICTLVKQPIGFGPTGWSIWSAEVDSYRAPKGKLDGLLPVFLTIHDSGSFELPWFNVVQQIATMMVNMEKQKLQDAIDNLRTRMDLVHELARKSSEQVSNQIRKNFEDQQEKKAQAHEQFMDYVNDLQGFTNSATGAKVKAPAGYSRVFQSSNGGLICTNDPTFQPPLDPKTSWQELQKTP